MLLERIESSGKRIFKPYNKTSRRSITSVEVELREARRQEKEEERRQVIEATASSRALIYHLGKIDYQR